MSDTLAHVAEVPPRVPDAKRTGTARLIGGYVGARMARRVNEDHLRIAVVVFSVGVAVYLAAT